MATILYLSNRLVQVIDAREKGKTITVQNIWQGNAPEGSIINGIITDEEVFLSWITEFFSKNKLPKKESMLVVNSSQFGHKVLEFPKIKEAELRKMIPREFSENRTDNTLFTYCVLDGEKDDKKQRVLATAVEKDFLVSYITFFKQAGIEVVSVDSGISALVRMFVCAPEIQNKTCLIQVIDGQEIVSMLFVEGKYYYSQKNRVFESDSTEGVQKAIASVTGKLLQFATSQQIKEPIELLYLCGEDQQELLEMMPERERFRGEKILTFAKGKNRDTFVYAAGSLLGKQQGVSLYKQIKLEQKEKKKKRETLFLLMPSLMVLIVCLMISAFMGRTYLSGLKELGSLQKSLQDTETVNEYARYKMYTANVESMNMRMAIVEDTWNYLMSYPTINSSIEKVLLDCAGSEVSLSIKNFQRDSGVMTLEAKADNVRNINGFIEKLQKQECFEAVEYSGYTYVYGSGTYNIHVVLCMAEGAGR